MVGKWKCGAGSRSWWSVKVIVNVLLPGLPDALSDANIAAPHFKTTPVVKSFIPASGFVNYSSHLQTEEMLV